MTGIQRGIVFTKSQMQWLEKRAREYSVSVSEVVRRIVDEKREGIHVDWRQEISARSST